jgi:NADPH:quinone reductase-like Zn-dependent oxidoreductase
VDRTLSTEEKARIVRGLGDADVVYRSDYDFKIEVVRLRDGKGVDLAIDGLGEKILLNTIATLGRGGTVVAIGAASGPIPAIQPTVLTPRGLRLAGGSVFTYVPIQPNYASVPPTSWKAFAKVGYDWRTLPPIRLTGRPMPMLTSKAAARRANST